jgi:NADH dehydrogenase (ubiquinone) 1 alpha subcomplex subunit 9
MQYVGKPLITPDLAQLWSEDFIPQMTEAEYNAQPVKDKILTLKDLGVDPLPLEKVAFNYLHRFRTGGHFALTSGYHG